MGILHKVLRSTQEASSCSHDHRKSAGTVGPSPNSAWPETEGPSFLHVFIALCSFRDQWLLYQPSDFFHILLSKVFKLSSKPALACAIVTDL